MAIKKVFPAALSLFSILFFLTAVSGCDTSSNSDAFDAEVTKLEVSNNVIDLGDGTVVTAGFTFDTSSVFKDGENVTMVVQLPAGLSYRHGTAEIDDEVGDQDIDPEVIECPAGESYLSFDMDDNNLDDLNDPSGEAIGNLMLTVDGNEPGPWLIQARARQDVVFYGCGQAFNSDASVYLTVR